MSDKVERPAGQEDLEIVHDPGVPNVFADGYWGIAVFGDVVRLHWYRLHVPAGETTAKRLIVASLSVPLGSFWSVLDGLNEFRRLIATAGPDTEQSR